MFYIYLSRLIYYLLCRYSPLRLSGLLSKSRVEWPKGHRNMIGITLLQIIRWMNGWVMQMIRIQAEKNRVTVIHNSISIFVIIITNSIII